MRPPSLAVARLAPRFGWHRLHYSKDYLNSNSRNDCSGWIGILSLSVLVPIANQTGFHATTAVKARRPCTRYFTSLLHRQASGQECVLQRATPIEVHVDAAATVETFSLEAVESPPVQRGRRSSATEWHEHANRSRASTSQSEYSFRRKRAYRLRPWWMTGDSVEKSCVPFLISRPLFAFLGAYPDTPLGVIGFGAVNC